MEVSATITEEEDMRNFRELKVWQKAHQLTLAVYKATAGFPRDERYGLTSQTRRASASTDHETSTQSGGSRSEP